MDKEFLLCPDTPPELYGALEINENDEFGNDNDDELIYSTDEEENRATVLDEDGRTIVFNEDNLLTVLGKNDRIISIEDDNTTVLNEDDGTTVLDEDDLADFVTSAKEEIKTHFPKTTEKVECQPRKIVKGEKDISYLTAIANDPKLSALKKYLMDWATAATIKSKDANMDCWIGTGPKEKLEIHQAVKGDYLRVAIPQKLVPKEYNGQLPAKVMYHHIFKALNSGELPPSKEYVGSHICFCKRCGNPDHIEWETNQIQRKRDSNRCPGGNTCNHNGKKCKPNPWL